MLVHRSECDTCDHSLRQGDVNCTVIVESVLKGCAVRVEPV